MDKLQSSLPIQMIKRESGLVVGLVTLFIFLMFGGGWLSQLSGSTTPLLLFLWLFPVMLWLSFGVVHHADCLAVKLGEPYGTLILTLSVISIEVVMISAVMLNGDQNPALGRDMMFAVLMIALNGLVVRVGMVEGLEEAVCEQQLGEVLFGQIHRGETELSCLIVPTDNKT